MSIPRAEPTGDLRDRIAQMLAAHEYDHGGFAEPAEGRISGGGWFGRCRCGDVTWSDWPDLAELRADHYKHVADCVAALLAHQDTPEALPVWQACPVCNGAGHLWRPPYVPGDQPTWMATEIKSHPCSTCAGSGIIDRATGKPSLAVGASTLGEKP